MHANRILFIFLTTEMLEIAAATILAKTNKRFFISLHFTKQYKQ